MSQQDAQAFIERMKSDDAFREAVIRLEADPDLSERIAQAGWELCSRTFRVE